MANLVDPDQASGLGLHYFIRPVHQSYYEETTYKSGILHTVCKCPEVKNQKGEEGYVIYKRLPSFCSSIVIAQILFTWAAFAFTINHKLFSCDSLRWTVGTTKMASNEDNFLYFLGKQ